ARLAGSVSGARALSGPSSARTGPLDEARPHAHRHQVAQVRVGLEDPRDVDEIVLPLAAAPRLVLHGPDLPLQNVIDGRHRKLHVQHHSCLLWRGAGSENGSYVDTGS